MQFVLMSARAHPGLVASRHQRDRSSRVRPVSLHPLILQVQLLRWPGIQNEPVAGNGWRNSFEGRLRTAMSRIQAHPPQPAARRGRLELEDLAPVQELDLFASL